MVAAYRQLSHVVVRERRASGEAEGFLPVPHFVPRWQSGAMSGLLSMENSESEAKGERDPLVVMMTGGRSLQIRGLPSRSGYFLRDAFGCRRGARVVPCQPSAACFRFPFSSDELNSCRHWYYFSVGLPAGA
jgi:hypothetical protein